MKTIFLIVGLLAFLLVGCMQKNTNIQPSDSKATAVSEKNSEIKKITTR